MKDLNAEWDTQEMFRPCAEPRLQIFVKRSAVRIARDLEETVTV